MRRVLVILDVQYLFASACYSKKRIDLQKLIEQVRSIYPQDQVSFLAYLLNNKDEPSKVESLLKSWGATVSVKKVGLKPSQASPVSQDVRIVIDVLDRLSDLDVLVLCLGKASYTDLVQRCHLYSKAVHVWAFDFSLSEQLRQSCDQVFTIEKFDVLRGNRV